MRIADNSNMMNRALALLAPTTLVVSMGSCDSTEPTEEDARELLGFESLSGPYLGQELPASEPTIFLPGLVSTHDMEGCVAFLDQARVMVFFSSLKGTLYTYEKGGHWISPKEAPFQNTHGSGITDFTAGPDGRTLYFQSSRPTSPEDTERDTNIWVVEWTGSGWTEPLPLRPPANTGQESELYPSVSRDGSVYFFARAQPESSAGDIYRSRSSAGSYLRAERLEFPISTDYYEVDPVVAPDGSYLLFGSGRPGGYGLNDLYVSFRRNDGEWSHPHSVGKEINELIFAIRMSVTPDGRYFFFLSHRPTSTSKGKAVHSPRAERWGDSDVYWVDTEFIRELEQRFRNKQCAAEVIRNHYDESGLEPALKKMEELTTDERYYFELSELLILVGSLIESGKLVDADRLYEALLQTFPDEPRIVHGYAVAQILNGSTQRGLERLKEVWTQYPSAKPPLSLMILSFQLLAKSKDQDALEVLEFGAREIGTFNSVLDLAEAHARLGNKEQAIESCKKALELKPDFVEALDLLEQLEGR
jgi:tetratricopeptide (TPR) repeat protein